MQTWKRGALWSLAAIALLAVAASGKSLLGQSSGDASRPAAPAVNKSWPEVNLNVVVLDKHDVPQEIDEQKFQLFEDGSERPLEFRAAADSPMSIALLIDTSGSMYKRKPAILSVVTEIVKSLPAGSEVMAVQFDDQSFLDLPFTDASKIDYSFLNEIYRGGTALFDTVVATENYFAAHARCTKRAIVLLSDGGDNTSHVPMRAAIQSLLWPGAPTFYSFVFSDSHAAFGQKLLDKRDMQELAKAGGGVAFTATETDLVSNTARFVSVIRSQYVLTFAAADPARNSKARKLEVRLPDKDLQIHALRVYYAPAQ